MHKPNPSVLVMSLAFAFSSALGSACSPTEVRSERAPALASKGTAGDVDRESANPTDPTANRARIGIIWASWHPSHFQDVAAYLDRVESFRVKRVSLVPTYFINTYEEGIVDNPSNTPTSAQQKAVLKELLRRGFWINYRPHIDPFKFTLNADAQQYVTTDPGGKDWRGKFDQLDPMKSDYKDQVILHCLKTLAEAISEIRSEDPALVIHKVRFDLGAELMDSEVLFTEHWLELQSEVRATLAARYPAVAPYIELSHNFCHHLEYLTRLPGHLDYLGRINPDGQPKDADLFVDRMTPEAKRTLGRYIAGLDAFSLSQYMPLDILAGSDGPTPDSVRHALLQHERTFFQEVLVHELGMAADGIPPFHIGELGIGIRGLSAPNVWDKKAWTPTGKLPTSAEQRKQSQTAMEGVARYMKDPSAQANTLMLWLGGAPYDIFELNAYSTGAYNQGAVQAITTYLTENP